MKRLITGLALGALAVGGVALAEQTAEHMRPGMATMSRADMLTHAGQMFDKMDVNHDGKIDQADREARKAAMFDQIDTDHNGQISRAEFMAFRPMHGDRGMEHGQGQGQGMGGSGMDGHEMGDGMGGPGHGGHRGGHGMGMGRGMGMMMLRMADTNHDGAVSRDEFMAAATQHFDRMDANHDGKVTPEERQAMRAQMRSQMHDRMDHDGAMGSDMGAPPPPAN
jgi:Ca2+-binding EF-hand superfamily protein